MEQEKNYEPDSFKEHEQQSEKQYMEGSNMKINVCVDDQRFKEKPTKKNAKDISNRIALNDRHLTVEELAKELTYPNGRTSKCVKIVEA